MWDNKKQGCSFCEKSNEVNEDHVFKCKIGGERKTGCSEAFGSLHQNTYNILDKPKWFPDSIARSISMDIGILIDKFEEFDIEKLKLFIKEIISYEEEIKKRIEVSTSYIEIDKNESLLKFFTKKIGIEKKLKQNVEKEIRKYNPENHLAYIIEMHDRLSQMSSSEEDKERDKRYKQEAIDKFWKETVPKARINHEKSLRGFNEKIDNWENIHKRIKEGENILDIYESLKGQIEFPEGIKIFLPILRISQNGFKKVDFYQKINETDDDKYYKKMQWALRRTRVLMKSVIKEKEKEEKESILLVSPEVIKTLRGNGKITETDWILMKDIILDGEVDDLINFLKEINEVEDLGFKEIKINNFGNDADSLWAMRKYCINNWNFKNKRKFSK